MSRLIPLGILLIIGFFALLIGILSQQMAILGVGIAYMVMPVFMVFLYGLIGMLGALVYNWLSGKFGGLEITVAEKDERAAIPASFDAVESSYDMK